MIERRPLQAVRQRLDEVPAVVLTGAHHVDKWLRKPPRISVRDSGLVHALLAIRDLEGLLAHPVVGASWEGFVIENLLAVAPEHVEGYFYWTAGGAEVDLLLRFADRRTWAIEIKRSLSPRPGRGFHAACEDLRPHRRLVVYPGDERYPLGGGVEAIPLPELARELGAER